MVFRTLALALLLFGIVLMTIGFTKMTVRCPPPSIEYRYIPRNMYEEAIYDQNVMSKFKKMFSDQTPGIDTQREKL